MTGDLGHAPDRALVPRRGDHDHPARGGVVQGRSQPAFPSRFLTEIPQSMLAAPQGSAPVAPPRQGYKERLVERQVQAAPAEPPVQRFWSGDRVTHPAFGAGTVVKSTLTRTDEELVIKFDKAGLKILSGMLAPLTK